MSKFINISDISQYRQLLMGVGILGVMFSHWFGFQSISQGIPYRFADFLCKLVFTEGFLFLSGFGLYYSFSSKADIVSFYKKRVIRLYVPFFVLSFPLYTYFLFYRYDYTFSDYLKQLSTFYFWTNGNYGGMWYVSLSMVLYLCFPYMFKFLFRRCHNRSILIRTLLLVIFVYFLGFTIQLVDATYYGLISIGVGKIVFFILGCTFAFEIKNKMLSRTTYTQLLLGIILLYSYLTIIRICGGFNYDWLMELCGVFQKLTYMPIICMIFNFIHKLVPNGIIEKCLNWMGKYSLELYILHLHFFMFFKFGFLKNLLPLPAQATIAIMLAVILCVPTNRFISFVRCKC